MKTFLRLVLSIVTLSPLPLTAQTEIWQVRQAPVLEHLYTIAYGRGVYVAAGNHRTILTSRDGEKWRLRSHNGGVPGWLSGIAYGNGTFVAVGSGRQPDNPLSGQYKGPPGSDGYTIGDNHYPIVTSRNGVHWHRLRRGQRSLTSVTYGGGLFVAIGHDGLLTSRDGHTWIRPTRFSDPAGVPHHPTLLPPDFQEVAYGNGRFVILGFRGNLVVSSNGVDWVNYSNYGGRGFGDLYASTLLFNDSAFIAAGSGAAQQMYSSLDGIHWSGTTSPLFVVADLAPGIDRVLAVGANGEGRGRIQSSPDGLNWSGSPTEVSGELAAVTWGRKGFVAVGFGGVIVHSQSQSTR